MNQASPTVFRRRVSDVAYGAWLTEHMEQERPVAKVTAQRPSFVSGYWDAFCEAHPTSAHLVALVGWYVAVMLTSVAAFQLLMWEVR
jgi:hypothetical protein